MAEIRVNSTGGVKLFDADDSHYAQIKAGTISSNTDVLELGSGAVVAGTKVDLNGQELILDADADTSITADTDDQIDVRIAGADDFQFTANTFTAQSGSSIVVPDGGLTFGSTAISSTAAELNILDGVTATTAELNLLDGGTSVGGSITLADGDGVVVNDGGTMKTIPASDVKTYAGGAVTAINNATANELVTIGSTTTELDAEANLTFDGEVLKILGNPSTTISQPYNLSIRNDTDGATSGDAKTGILFRVNYSGTTPTDIAGITAGKENDTDGEYGSFVSLNTRTNGVNTIAQRLIVDSSGRVNINTASAITTEGVLQVSGNSSQNLSAWRVATNGNVGLRFFNSSTQGVGDITINASGTAFNTSSDYRLKENAVAISDGITRLKTLKPYRFNFKTEPDTKVDGFFAHEVTAVPEAISGTKDAMAVETRYTADDVETQGDTPSKKVGDAKTYSSTEIDAQGIDQSKLVPLLTSALQEAITKIEALEARVTTLEG
jgi:DNA uptake protein ComE-like DNA-binding protein